MGIFAWSALFEKRPSGRAIWKLHNLSTSAMGRTKQTYDPAKGNADFIATHKQGTSIPGGPERKQAGLPGQRDRNPAAWGIESY
jgi:hypothetical protein